CIPRLIGKHGKHFALADAVAALHAQFGDDAIGARRDAHFPVGEGAARQNEPRAVRHDLGLNRGHAERRLRRRLAGDRGSAFRRLVRQQIARADPRDRGGKQTDRSDATGFHCAGSLSVRMARIIFMAIGRAASALNDLSAARRHAKPSPIAISMLAVATKSIFLLMAPSAAAFCKSSISPFCTSASMAVWMRSTSALLRLSDMISAQSTTSSSGRSTK